MNLECAVLGADGRIPLRHAYGRVDGGQNISPPLLWSDVPPGAKQLFLSIIDIHPVARRWVHWAIAGIPPEATGIPENASGNRDLLPAGCRELSNSYGEVGYGGPAPPPGSGVHEYVFTLYALNTLRAVPSGLISAASFEDQLGDTVLARASVVGRFAR